MTQLHQNIIINSTLQLQKEYDHICYQYNVKLKRPLIIIENLLDSFGKWDPNRNCIFISENLILCYSWDKVISVLKHEMAHQFVTQIYGTDDAHGHDFNTACTRLGLDEIYRKSALCLSQDFPDWRNTDISIEEQSILRKVEKLLSLASSDNEHESYLAMENVRNITKKYNLSRLINNDNLHHVSLTINLKVKRASSSVFYISDILQEHYFVSVVFSKVYDIQKNEEHRTLVLMGEKHNILMAEYVYEYLHRQINVLWKYYQKTKKISAKFKGSYQKGVLEGFNHKLRALKANAEPQNQNINHENALIKVYATQLNHYVKTQFPKTSSVHQSGLIYKDHYDNGSKEGKRINLSRPINQKSSSGLLRFLNPGVRK